MVNFLLWLEHPSRKYFHHSLLVKWGFLLKSSRLLCRLMIIQGISLLCQNWHQVSSFILFHCPIMLTAQITHHLQFSTFSQQFIFFLIWGSVSNQAQGWSDLWFKIARQFCFLVLFLVQHYQRWIGHNFNSYLAINLHIFLFLRKSWVASFSLTLIISVLR